MTGPRFSILPGRAAADGRMTLSVLRVLAALGRHTDTAGWCFINQGRMAKELCVSRQAVNTAVKKLVEWGYLEKRATRRKDGGNGVCDYRVKLDQETEEEAADLSTGDDTPLSTPEATGGVKSEGDRGLSSLEFTTGTTHELTTHINEPKVRFDDEFSEWYEQYPRKAQRAKAEKAYRQARKRTTAKNLLDGVKRYAAWCRSAPATESQFIRHPATWLNGDGWEDELAPKDGKPAAIIVPVSGVPIRPNTPQSRAWLEHFAPLKATDREAAIKWSMLNQDRTIRADTEWPPGFSPRMEAAE